MPWKVDPVPEQRIALVQAVRTAGLSVAEAARRFGVSRQTAHAWLARHDADPAMPLADRSRRPARSPARTPEAAERIVLEARDRWGWGPRKLRALLLREGREPPPARTIAAILRRHGRTATAAPPPPAAEPPRRFERSAPNQLWQLDFKGAVEVDRRPVEPLTILDDHSRYLLYLRPCPDKSYASVRAALWEVFGDVGLPEAILCDNAFAARNLEVGLSSFDAWLIRLGVRPLHGRPYHPQTQGKVERLHGTLEAEVYPRARRDRLEHFAADLEAWRPVYNGVRPHEACGDEPPCCRWHASPRRRPARVPEVSYPEGSELRTVAACGSVRYRRSRIRVGSGLAGERVRLVEAAGQLEVYYASHRVRCIAAELLSADRTL